MKNKKVYFINIILVLSIFIITMLVCKVSPFGNNLLGYSDGIFQFKPMLYDLIMKIKTGILESYSFNNGLGNPLIFNMLYYLASPVNYVALLFNTPDGMYLSVLLVKMVIASITMTFYVSKKTDKTDVIIIATLSYIFCNWFLVYYYYFTWLDCFMIFPLYMYGLEEVINNKISYIYIFSLAYMIMTSFYLCFAICVFTIFYYIIYGLLYKKNSLKDKMLSFKRISISTIIALLLSFVVIYSLIYFSFKSGLHFDKNENYYATSAIAMLKSLIYAQTDFVIDYYGDPIHPNVACNTLILFNFIYFFFNKNIKKRDKIFALIGIFLSILVFVDFNIDFVFNFFHNIRGLTYRYAFIFSFLMVCIYIKNNQHEEKEDSNTNVRKLIVSLIIIIYIALLLPYLIDDNSFMGNGFVNLIFLVCVLVNIFINGHTKVDKLLIILVISIQSIYGLFHVSFQSVNKEYIDYKEYKVENDKYRNNINELYSLGYENEDRYNIN